SGVEWLRILLFIRKQNWTAPERKMMRAARGRYVLRIAATFFVVALFGWGAWEAWGYQRAATLVRVLEAANTADTTDTIRELGPYRRWADPMLQRVANDSHSDSRARLNACLALLPSDANRAGDVMEQLLQASPQELPALSKALRPYANTVNPRLWGVLDTDAAATHERFNAGLALAGLDPPYSTEKPAPWQGHATFLVDQFLKAARANPSSYAPLSEAMRPLRIVLLDALGAVFRDRRRPDYDRLLTTTLLADYAADQPGVL